MVFTLHQQISFIQLETKDIRLQAEKNIEVASNALNKLKHYIFKNKIKTQEQEIHIFKSAMPLILSYLIYYTQIRRFQLHCPLGGKEENKNYINCKLHRLKIFFEDNRDFVTYYRSKDTTFDHLYFMRGKNDQKTCKHELHYQLDDRYFSLHTCIMAQIMASEKIEQYLENQLANIDNPTSTNQIAEDLPKSVITWTGSKVELMEMIVALHEAKMFNDGNVEFNTVLNLFQKILNIQITQPNRTISEINDRKIEKAKFLNALTTALINRLDRVGEKNNRSNY